MLGRENLCWLFAIFAIVNTTWKLDSKIHYSLHSVTIYPKYPAFTLDTLCQLEGSGKYILAETWQSRGNFSFTCKNFGNAIVGPWKLDIWSSKSIQVWWKRIFGSMPQFIILPYLIVKMSKLSSWSKQKYFAD